jgi:RNA polymerase sigma factor (sigma-70 family)
MNGQAKSATGPGRNDECPSLPFEQIYDRYYSPILNYLFRLTLDIARAEELTSKTFFKAMAAFERYEEGGKCKSWLYAIATNEFRMHYRSAKRDQIFGRYSSLICTSH